MDADATDIACIYNHYIQHTTATFEIHPVTPDVMLGRIREVQSAGLPWLIAEHDDGIAGYAYAAKWKERLAYRHTVEVSAYVRKEQSGVGAGSALYTELFRLLEDSGFHTVLGGITLPNDASIAFHEKFGMKHVARFREVGYKHGRWIDIGYWQRIL